MLNRGIIKKLEIWLKNPKRKPLMLRRARQVGNTTIVKELFHKCSQFIYLNLELPEGKKPFEAFTNLENLLHIIFLLKTSNSLKRKIPCYLLMKYRNILQLLKYCDIFMKNNLHCQ